MTSLTKQWVQASSVSSQQSHWVQASSVSSQQSQSSQASVWKRSLFSSKQSSFSFSKKKITEINIHVADKCLQDAIL